MKMKKILVALILCGSLVNWHPVFAQKAFTDIEDKVKGLDIFMTLSGQKLTYSYDDLSLNGKPTTLDTTTLSLAKHNSCNIFINWFNPLKYQLTWKDSIQDDPREVLFKAFASQAMNQVGTIVTLPSLVKGIDDGKTQKSDGKTQKTKVTKKAFLQCPLVGFYFADLNLLYTILRYEDIMEGDIEKINLLTPLIVSLDSLNALNFATSIKSMYTELAQIQEPDNVQTTLQTTELELYGLNETIKETENTQTKIINNLTDFSLSDALLNKCICRILSVFLDQTKTTLAKNKGIILKMEPIMVLMKNSVQGFSVVPGTEKFYKNRTIEIKDGKIVVSSLHITEYKYDMEKNEMVKADKEWNHTFLFRRYDPVRFFTSTGAFIPNISLIDYGVTSDGNGQFTITKNEITKNTANLALFGNLGLWVGTRSIAPIIQCGLAHSVDNPLFILAGGGLALPIANVAITAGGIWTREAKLKTLAVGGTVASTSALQDDIEYDFTIAPKDWYIGLQYNF
jgi:hypothetical protein